MKINLFIFAALFGILLTVQSCSDDPCEETICLNGGQCDDGTCVCPTGWSGTYCETSTSNTNDSINGYTKDFVYDDTISVGDAVILGNGRSGYRMTYTGNGTDVVTANDNHFFIAQSFKTTSLAKGIKAIELQITNGDLTDHYVSIRNQVNGMPGSIDLEGKVAHWSGGGGSGNWIYPFSEPVSVDSDSTYFVVIRYSERSPSLDIDRSNPYPDGELWTSTDSSFTWQIHNQGQDDLELWVYESLTNDGMVYRSDPNWNTSDVIISNVGASCYGSCDNIKGYGDFWSNFIGIALENGLPGETHPIQIVGINDDQSNLETWKTYYMSSVKGKISLSAGAQSIAVGRALSETELLIKNF